MTVRVNFGVAEPTKLHDTFNVFIMMHSSN